jgi:hypothetical protein
MVSKFAFQTQPAALHHGASYHVREILFKVRLALFTRDVALQVVYLKGKF